MIGVMGSCNFVCLRNLKWNCATGFRISNRYTRVLFINSFTSHVPKSPSLNNGKVEFRCFPHNPSSAKQQIQWSSGV